MKKIIVEHLAPGALGETAITIGNFDGVHLGHLKVIQHLKERAKEKQLPTVAVTFEPHPVKILNPTKGLRMIFPISTRTRLIALEQVDYLAIINFTKELAAMSAEQFTREYIVEKFKAKLVVVGYDFNFGHYGDGDAKMMSGLGAKLGFEVDQVEPYEVEGRVVSSSRIRRLIRSGEMEMVAKLMGRPFHLTGHVITGKNRGGRLLGFPTANLSRQQEIVPAFGVYVTIVKLGDGRVIAGAANVGYNPTFETEGLKIEAHLLDFSDNIVGQPIEIYFLSRIRDEMRFDTVDHLVAQMQRDVSYVKKFLSGKDLAGAIH